MRNVGSNAAPWRFVPKLDDKHPCKSWITLSPSMGIILPNQVKIILFPPFDHEYQEITITISAVIDALTADKLNTAREVFFYRCLFSLSFRL